MTESPRPVIAEAIENVAQNPIFGRIGDLLQPAAQRAKDALGGAAEGEGTTGTPVHPALVHFPIGAQFSAAVLDAVGLRRAAGVVTGFGVVCALPTAVTGLVDFAGLPADKKHSVGALHATFAVAGTTFAALSLAARCTGRRGAARLALWAACGAYAKAGAVGGHLVYFTDAAE